MAGFKSDTRDGLVLVLSMRWERLEAVRPEDPKVRELTMLCHDEQRLIDDWTSPAAWSWLKRYPTPEKICQGL